MSLFHRYPRASFLVSILGALWLFASFWSFFTGERDVPHHEWHDEATTTN